jgi:hypothetical protein
VLAVGSALAAVSVAVVLIGPEGREMALAAAPAQGGGSLFLGGRF